MVPEARGYIPLLRQDYSLEASTELVYDGDRLLDVCDSLEDAAREMQEYNFRMANPVRGQIIRRQYSHSSTDRQVIDVDTVGAVPEYAVPKNPLPRESGIQYDSSESRPRCREVSEDDARWGDVGREQSDGWKGGCESTAPNVLGPEKIAWPRAFGIFPSYI